MSMRKDLRACSKTPPISEKTSMCNPFIVSATLTLSTGLKAMFASAQPLAAIWNWNDIAGNAANRFSEGIIRRDGIKRHGLPSRAFSLFPLAGRKHPRMSGFHIDKQQKRSNWNAARYPVTKTTPDNIVIVNRHNADSAF